MARLPCLATVHPAPAATKAAVVEMLKVPEASPPVPQVSRRGGRPPEMRVALARMTAANPATSSSVSPLQRKATRKPPIWASVVLPLMIWSITAVAVSRSRSCPAMSF